jgi:hypothetical protein
MAAAQNLYLSSHLMVIIDEPASEKDISHKYTFSFCAKHVYCVLTARPTDMGAIHVVWCGKFKAVGTCALAETVHIYGLLSV